MNEADRAPSPNKFWRKLGMRKAALKASAASDCRPKYLAKKRCRTRPAIRLRRMPAATSSAERDVRRAEAPATSVNVLIRRRVAQRAARFLHQEGVDESIEVAVEHAVDVADLFLRSVILDHPIRM